MNIKSLVINRQNYGKGKGLFAGTVSFDDELGKIDLYLSPEQCEKIFSICADGILEVAEKAAKQLTYKVIDHKKLLEQVNE